jgi:hypothetical protein
MRTSQVRKGFLKAFTREGANRQGGSTANSLEQCKELRRADFNTIGKGWGAEKEGETAQIALNGLLKFLL